MLLIFDRYIITEGKKLHPAGNNTEISIMETLAVMFASKTLQRNNIIKEERK